VKVVSGALLAALAVVVWWGAAHPIGSPDFGWQVALGRWILQYGSIPDTEPFTHTARGVPMVAHEWASQVIYAAVVDRFGVTALRFGHALLASGAVLLLFAWLRRAGLSAGVALLTVVLWVWLAESRFQLRPHMWNVLLFVLAYGALFLARPRLSRPQLFGFFAGTVGWVNLHPGAMLLPAAAAVYAVAATYEQRVLGRAPAESELGEGRLQRLWTLTGLLLLAILVSPHYASLFGYVVESGRVNANLSLEWASIASERGLSTRTPGWVALFFGLSLATGVTAYRRVRVAGFAPIAVVLFVTALPYVSQRFLWTCFVPLAFVALNLPEIKHRNVLAAAASAGAIAWLGLGLAEAPPLSRDFRSAKFPVEAMTFLARTQFEGKLFNSNKWGGYVLFRTGEHYPVFVDGRWITIGERIVRDSHAIANRTPGHVELLDDYEIEILLVHRGWMTEAIRARGGWISVFENVNSGVYLRPGPALEANLDRSARYYAARGVDFSREVGFVERDAIRSNSEWARSMRVQRRHLDQFGAHGRRALSDGVRWVEGW
jgi:hypothetical protein